MSISTREPDLDMSVGTYAIPTAFFRNGVCVPLVAYLAWHIYGTVSEKTGGKLSPALQSATGQSSNPAPVPVRQVQPVTYEQLVYSFTPRVAAMPETAPAYDHLRHVKVLPRIVGGYCQGAFCRCYTQQHTDPGIGQDACRAWVKSPPFDPYREPERPVQSAAAPSPAPAPPSPSDPS